MPVVDTPASAAPSSAATTPIAKAISSPIPTMSAMAANENSMYRVRPSPRATAALSVPQDHSEPATAAP